MWQTTLAETEMTFSYLKVKTLKIKTFADSYSFLSHFVLMAVMSKALPRTARRLSPPPRFESRLGHVTKLPVTV